MEVLCLNCFESTNLDHATFLSQNTVDKVLSFEESLNPIEQDIKWVMNDEFICLKCKNNLDKVAT